MRYDITLRNKNIITVEKNRGERLKEALLKPKPPANVEINGELYRTSEIVSITLAEERANVETFFPGPPPVDLNACRGQYSIQREINMIIRHEHPRDWGNKIRDKKLRAKLREELLSQATWCDAKEDICFCEDDYKNPGRPKELKSITDLIERRTA